MHFSEGSALRLCGEFYVSARICSSHVMQALCALDVGLRGKCRKAVKSHELYFIETARRSGSCIGTRWPGKDSHRDRGAKLIDSLTEED